MMSGFVQVPLHLASSWHNCYDAALGGRVYQWCQLMQPIVFVVMLVAGWGRERDSWAAGGMSTGRWMAWDSAGMQMGIPIVCWQSYELQC
jgi:hypothetical protein